MCLLSFHDDGVVAEYNALRIGAENNPDGFGYAVHTGSDIIRGRGLNFEAVYADYVRAMRSGGVSMFHHRWATHGEITKKNCHPFLVGGDSRTVLGHNGILSVAIAKGDTRSDTRIFSDKIFPRLGGVRALDGEGLSPQVRAAVGDNKIVILTTDRLSSSDWFIINEAGGHWVGHSWFSNYSYEPYISIPYVARSLSTLDYLHEPLSVVTSADVMDCEQCPCCWAWTDFTDEEQVFNGCLVCGTCFFCCEDVTACRCSYDC